MGNPGRAFVDRRSCARLLGKEFNRRKNEGGEKSEIRNTQARRKPETRKPKARNRNKMSVDRLLVRS